jgi:hypothetical protein
VNEAEKELKILQDNYQEENIVTLEWKEHIRRRPGMYIGKLGDGSSADDGIYVLLKEVLFIGGSDEHGIPITIKARKEGVTPQDIVDRYHELIKKSFKEFGITFDIYSRTTSEIHKETASDFFRKLYEKGEFSEQESEQYYDEEAQQFLADRYITGSPICFANSPAVRFPKFPLGTEKTVSAESKILAN